MDQLKAKTEQIEPRTNSGEDALLTRSMLRLPDVIRVTGRSRSAIYAAMNPRSQYFDPKFPRQISLSARCVGWRASAVFAYLEGLGAQPEES